MKVSIVIDNYNYAEYLPTAIDSALAQSWEDTEVIVVDDGSTDTSVTVLERYEDRVVSVRQANQGQGVALSNGFAKTSGDVVIFLDADDVLDPEAAAEVANTFAAKSGVARAQWPLRVIDGKGSASGAVTPDPQAMASGDLGKHVIQFRTHVWPATSGNAYSRRALQELMPIPSSFTLGGDLYLAETTPLLGRVMSFDHPLGSYRQHGKNAWVGRHVDAALMHQKIAWTVASHEEVKRVAAENGLACPDDATEALDVAFICQRLASLRLDPVSHPIAGDTRLRLTLRGLLAAVAHPHHRPLHKLKRVAWLVGVGCGPLPVARRLIDRFYG